MLASTMAMAENEPFELEWNAPAQCPPTAHVAARIQHLASALPLRSEPLVVRASIAIIPGGFALDLGLQQNGQVSNRHLTSSHCDELAEATALAASLALHTVRTPLGVASSNSVPTRTPSDTALRLSGMGDFDVGPLPAPQGRIRLELAYRSGPARVLLNASTGFSQIVLGVPRPDAGATVHLPFAGGVAACGVPIHDTWEVEFCAGIEAGLFAATGREIAASNQCRPLARSCRSSGSRIGLHLLGVTPRTADSRRFAQPTSNHR